jgi:hypothetical protein
MDRCEMIVGVVVGCCGRGLFVDAVSLSYKGFRYPAEIIAHCVWL